MLGCQDTVLAASLIQPDSCHDKSVLQARVCCKLVEAVGQLIFIPVITQLWLRLENNISGTRNSAIFLVILVV